MTHPNPLIDRHVLRAVQDAVADTRVIVVLGARQVGKSTLIEQLAKTEGSERPILTLDSQAVREAALTDPAGFVAGLDVPIAIDEVQRAPELMTEIKLRVDREKTPGQIVLTGSANLLEMRRVKETLAGRAEYIRLFPFSQGEIRGRPERFITRLAAGEFPQITGASVGRRAHASILARGGFPEAQHRTASRRARYFESYVEGVMEKEVVTLGDVAEPAAVARLFRAIGAISASELNIDGLSSSTGTPASTIRRRVDMLETLFLVKRLPAWGGNMLARAIKRPKIHVLDTGLLAYLVSADERRIEQDLDLSGSFYETFVAMELQKQASWLPDRPELFHFRDRDGREVDVVLEFRDGSVIGIEVKSAATLRSRDMRGLEYLRDKLGSRFKAGALIYAGAETASFGDRLAAVPLSGLWA